MITRFHTDLKKYLKANKVLVIYGPRRVGKTTLIEQYLQNCDECYRLVSGESFEVQQVLSSNKFDDIFAFCEGLDLLVIDEAHNISNIGRSLKIIVDHIKGLKVIATGSSSFDLANQVGEPLVGRQKIVLLFPPAQLELSYDLSRYELKSCLSDYLRFGSYPEVLMLGNNQDKSDYLLDLINSYLYKDILALNTIKNSSTLQKLVKLLAFYIGSEISANELSRTLGVDLKTVIKYLDLLQECFIIIKLTGFSGNLAKELTKKSKYYFYDLGVRNAVINQFNDLDNRNDIGALWENFIVLERLKRNSYLRSHYDSYFWRTYAQQEVDYLEHKDDKLDVYEIKWSDRAKSHNGIKTFKKFYPKASTHLINPKNYLDFIL